MLDRPTLTTLRQSHEYVSFHARWEGGQPAESYAIGKRRDAVGEDYTNVRWELPSFLGYGSGILREHTVIRAYASVSTPRYHELWQTILACLRTGDECKLVWSANGHANSLVHEAGLCADTCELEVLRKNRRLRFHISETICKPNTARMFTAGERGIEPVYGPNPTMLATHGPNA